MNYLFIVIFFYFSNAFIFPGLPLHRTFTLDVKPKNSKRELQLYEERHTNIYLPKTLNQQTYVDYMWLGKDRKNIQTVLISLIMLYRW